MRCLHDSTCNSADDIPHEETSQFAAAAAAVNLDKGKKAPGFTEGLLQLSIAIWIINYPIVMPFAANRQVGELRGGGGVQGG